jgi:hypothetical protein
MKFLKVFAVLYIGLWFEYILPLPYFQRSTFNYSIPVSGYFHWWLTGTYTFLIVWGDFSRIHTVLYCIAHCNINALAQNLIDPWPMKSILFFLRHGFNVTVLPLFLTFSGLWCLENLGPYCITVSISHGILYNKPFIITCPVHMYLKYCKK